MSRLLRVGMVVVMLAGITAIATPARATHHLTNKGGTCPASNIPPAGCHENSPTPPIPPTTVENVCTVQGTVDIDNHATPNSGGVSEQGDHNHFEFTTSSISCDGTNANTAGVFDVKAAGGTDGPQSATAPPVVPGVHGEVLNAGWSHSSCYAADCPGTAKGVDDIYAGTFGPQANLGEITVARADGKASASPANWLKFCRGVYDDNAGGPGGAPNEPKCTGSTGGGNVIAWGQLNWTAGGPKAPTCFHASLTFVPDAPDPAKLNITRATLVGTAVTWTAGGTPATDCLGTKK